MKSRRENKIKSSTGLHAGFHRKSFAKLRVLAQVTLAALTVAILVACGQVDQPRTATTPHETLAVHVTSSGVISVDGREVTLEELKKEFARLASVGGAVLYTRDNPTADPHPNAMKVIQAVVDAGVTLLMPEK